MEIKLAQGNHKIGKDTLIINITSAHDCISRKLGLCKHPEKCYAYSSECFRVAHPINCLKSRRKSARAWDKMTDFEIVRQIEDKIKISKKYKIKYLRFSESGDFKHQGDVEKLFRIANRLKNILNVYGYTARRDLDFRRVPDNMTINGSNFMVHNNFKARPAGVIDNYNGLKCKMNCRICNLCKVRRKRIIMVKFHGNGIYDRSKIKRRMK